MVKKKTIAVTGATGFVGRHLVEYLEKEGFTVRLLHWSGEKLRKDTNAYRGDLLKDKNLNSFLKKSACVVNLVGGYYPPFEEQIKLNVLTLDNLCRAVVRNNVKKIIHVSAAAAYGEKEGKRYKETDVLNPTTTYGLSKKMAEEVLEYYYRTHDLDVVILRPPNIYGPGSDHGVIANFTKSSKEEKCVTIFGDGKQKRDFLYVGDFIRAITKSINYRPGGFEVFNVGSGRSYSILEVVSVIEKVLGEKIKINTEKETGIATRDVSVNIEKIKSKIKWRPKISLVDGLNIMMGRK